MLFWTLEEGISFPRAPNTKTKKVLNLLKTPQSSFLERIWRCKVCLLIRLLLDRTEDQHSVTLTWGLPVWTGYGGRKTKQWFQVLWLWVKTRVYRVFPLGFQFFRRRGGNHDKVEVTTTRKRYVTTTKEGGNCDNGRW